MARRLLVVVTILGMAGLTLAPITRAGVDPGVVRIEVLSNRPDLLSGGDALIEIVLPSDADPAGLSATVGTRDVSESFAERADGRILGVVEGLGPGNHIFVAELPDGRGARLTLTNHPNEGPIFSGPHLQPWICENEASGLDAPTDEHCNAPTEYDFRYKSSVTGLFQSYDPDSPPTDVAQTTTDEGKTVPYIIRYERGVIDRGIYDIVVLWDPADPEWTPWDPQEAWNGKLYYHFGGDCQPDHSPAEPESVLDPWSLANAAGASEHALSRGYAVATAALNILGRNCNDVVSAESVMMVKEHFIEAYGEPRYTIGQGSSGGSMQQHLLAANYPGLLDGIQPMASFPDVWTVVSEAADCRLLLRYFEETSTGTWPAPQQSAVTGHATISSCQTWDRVFGAPNGYPRVWLDPTIACGTIPEPPGIYNAETNPDGVRCTIQDYQSNVFGLREDGFANRPYDNMGVQYGLAALEAGTILPEQFVDLNEKVGGWDIDLNWQPDRSEADSAALDVAYRTGQVTSGRELASVPIVDIRGTSNFEIHTDFHTWEMRERLLAANGHADNQVTFTDSGPLVPHPEMVRTALATIDEWLAAIDADHDDAPLELKVVRNKPEGLTDTCYIAEQAVTDRATCDAAFPYFGDPRIAASAPLIDNVLKCRLKDLDREDYEVVFTDDQWARLEEAFPSGVCDWSKPGVGEQPSIPWLTFENGPGGERLGRPPTSTPYSETS